MYKRIFLLALLSGIAVGFFATVFMGIATVAFVLLSAGVVYRKKKNLHVILMNSGIILDLVLVLILQIQRSAIQTAVSFSLSPLQQAHVLTSATATLFYFPVVVLGWLRYKEILPPAYRKYHVGVGVIAYVFRALGFLLMFTLLGRSLVAH